MGPLSPGFAAVLEDWAFYLLTNDFTADAVSVTRMALKIRSRLFPGANLLLALTHESLAYALYVLEYNSGFFAEAKYVLHPLIFT